MFWFILSQRGKRVSKSKILIIVTIFELVSLVLSLFITIDGFELKKIWFSNVLILIGIYALVYATMFQLDSSLYLGALLFSLGLTSGVRFVGDYTFNHLYSTYLFCFAFADLAVFALFRQNIHFKLFAILFIQAILLVSYKTRALNVYALIAINVALAMVVIISLIYRVRKNLRSKK